MPSLEDKRELKALRLRKAWLKQLLKRLTWEPEVGLTQEEVASLLETSRWEVRRIELRALAKVRRAAIQLLCQTPDETQP